MKILFCKAFLFTIFIAYSFISAAQADSLQIDSLKKVLLTEKEDTNKVNTLIALDRKYFGKYDATNFLATNQKALSLAKQLNFKKGEEKGYRILGYWYSSDQNKVEALQGLYATLKAVEKAGNKTLSAEMLSHIGDFYSDWSNFEDGSTNMLAALRMYRETDDSAAVARQLSNLGWLYSQQDKYTDSHNYLNASLKLYKKLGEENYPIDVVATYESVGILDRREGLAALSTGDQTKAAILFDTAMANFQEALRISEKVKSLFAIGEVYLEIGGLYVVMKKYSRAKKFLVEGLDLTLKHGTFSNLPDGYYALAAVDSAEGNYKEAYKNFKIYDLYHDSLLNTNAQRKVLQTSIQFAFDTKEAAAKAAQDKKDSEAKRIKNQQYFAIASLGVLVLAVLIIALIQFRNNKQKQRANYLLEKQKEKVESALTELKSTQAQLIQSEKMASLGELTAGIAHEIQNPLNFVNNFSDVNKELLEELKEEADKGNLDEVKAIADDVISNEVKINHHGKRADSIVKGMLQHSRQTKGMKESTDINALCDEYLRLSYHGLRAKDKSFNAHFKTDFDGSIGKTNIVTQDIGRVLLNLFNNAFYAVNEKKKVMANSYQPTVEVKTREINDHVEIVVSDNGNGIPETIIKKIFQPFFTTKPTGEGTGLGLSLAYDIITKEHKGTIKAESKNGEGSEFIIQLPLK